MILKSHKSLNVLREKAFTTCRHICLNRSHTYLTTILTDAFGKDTRGAIFALGTESFEHRDVVAIG